MPRLLPKSLLATAVLFTNCLPQSTFAACQVAPSAGIAVHVVQSTDKAGQLQCGQTSWGGCGENGLVTKGSVGESYTVYLVAIGLIPESGLTQISVGIDYDGASQQGVDVIGWSSCSDVSTPENNWPEPGGGIELRFTSCEGSQPDTLDSYQFAITVLGRFYVSVYGPDVFSVTPMAYREHPIPRLTDCNGTEKLVAPYRLGSATFGLSGGGWNPCPFIDAFNAPCCFQDSCVAFTAQTCCLDEGGTPLNLGLTCEDCLTSATPITWSKIKARYGN